MIASPGTPDCTLKFTNANVLIDPAFHPCVRLVSAVLSICFLNDNPPGYNDGLVRDACLLCRLMDVSPCLNISIPPIQLVSPRQQFLFLF